MGHQAPLCSMDWVSTQLMGVGVRQWEELRLGVEEIWLGLCH